MKNSNGLQIDIATMATHTCKIAGLSEVRLSGCAYGCKVMICAICHQERVIHSTIYGCQQDQAHAEALRMDSDFRPVEGPSLAMQFTRWLDRGLPAETWVRYVRSLVRLEDGAR